MTTKRDVVLITVDSWRLDTIDNMTNANKLFEAQSEVLTSGAATNWVFPSILSSTQYPDAYNSEGLVRSNLVTLPEVLSDDGYRTGAFVACNPYLSKWEDRFDEFSNIGLSTSDGWYRNRVEQIWSQSFRTALFRKRTPAISVVKQAQKWFTSQDQPRFLWIHLMDPHIPYFPGLSQAKRVGLGKSYLSTLSYQRYKDDTPSAHMATQRQLYDKCVENVDNVLPDILSFVDENSHVVLTADHGEEFYHGHYDHERLYDECVRVPLYTNQLPAVEGPVRQIDLAPTIVDTLGLACPERWQGTVHDGRNRPVEMLTPQNSHGLYHMAVRYEKEKIIKSIEKDTGNIAKLECYNLATDPEEKHPISENDVSGALHCLFDAFLSRYGSEAGMKAATGIESAAVEEQLRSLGYTD